MGLRRTLVLQKHVCFTMNPLTFFKTHDFYYTKSPSAIQSEARGQGPTARPLQPIGGEKRKSGVGRVTPGALGSKESAGDREFFY